MGGCAEGVFVVVVALERGVGDLRWGGVGWVGEWVWLQCSVLALAVG